MKLSIIFSLLVWSLSMLAVAAPKSEYWEMWDRHNAANDASIKHSAWDEFLANYLTEDAQGTALVRYAEVTGEDKADLEAYIASLSNIDPRRYSRPEQMAYWFNLYNALTVNLILENYPVKSIRKIGKGFFSFGPWNDEIVTIAGQELTLNDIEHRILRPIWQDKRIHYGVNCASIGCPNLLTQAFTAANLESQLELATRTFINQKKAVQFDGRQLVLSSIYDWYGEDFGSWPDLRTHLLEYLKTSDKARLQDYDGDIDYEYDWDLNDAN